MDAEAHVIDADDPVCLLCIGDKELRHQLREAATREICASCGKRRLTVPLRDLAARIDDVYRAHYEPGLGNEPQWIIQEIAEVEEDIAEAVAKQLHDEEWHDVMKDGAEPYYDPTSTYSEREIHPTELQLEWEEFCRRIKHERRFFDEAGRLILGTILGDGIRSDDNPLSVCVVRLKKGERLFRARRADSAHAAAAIMADPRRQLGPPPRRLAIAGRMNSAGIPVFYGGFTEDVCVAEVRPHVGGAVVTGQFRVVRPLRLLDLTMLDEHGFAGSYFGDKFHERLEKRLFLRKFHDLISRPVQPHEEALEYVPTQAVAEYIANVLGLDGIIYASAQTDRRSNEEEASADRATRNVALFTRASVVAGSRRRQTRGEREARFLLDEMPLLEDVEGYPPPSPSLQFVRNSARTVRVTGIKVSHERADLV